MCALTGSLLVVALALVTVAKADDTEILPAVANGVNKFSSPLLEIVAEENSGNLIWSPLGVDIVLGMPAYGAYGETKEQFRNVLHFPCSDRVGKLGYQALIDNLNEVKENEVILANKIFSSEKYTVKESYTEMIKTYFRSAVQAVDFSDSVEAASIINTWVAQNTSNLINNIIKPDDVNGNTLLVLVNALYFKGQWKQKFDTSQTTGRPFHINKDTVKNVSTMHIKGDYTYGYLEQLNASFVVLPYKDDELSLIVIRPDEIDGLVEIERKLQSTSLSSILNSGYKSTLDLYLPKFKTESTLHLNAALVKLGLNDAFTLKADFSGIANVPLEITQVIQKAFIEVNENGTEAAAATVVRGAVSATGAIGPLTVEIDRPFYFSIIKPLSQNKEDNVILFTGHIVNP